MVHWSVTYAPNTNTLDESDIAAIRQDFPILSTQVNGHPLVYLDSGATSQKPSVVLDAERDFSLHRNSAVHRGAHTLAALATEEFEAARETVARFVGADADEIVWTSNATEGINLVAYGISNATTAGTESARFVLGTGDEILVTELEHHANLIPWQQLALRTGATLRFIPVDDDGALELDRLDDLITERTRVVAVAHVSNVLGVINPVETITRRAHAVGALVVLDACQSAPHLPLDLHALEVDFAVFSGHKIFGPTGIGVVYGKRDILEAMPPWQGGGNMIADVTFEKTVYQPIPNKFEAGTGNIADAVGLGAAIDYVNRVGIENIARYEHELLVYGMAQLRTIPGVRLIGTADDKASVMSFVLAGYTTEEVGQALNDEGIAVRTGHHCAQPILRRFGVETTVRPSLAFYNTFEEIDRLIAVVRRLASVRRVG